MPSSSPLTNEHGRRPHLAEYNRIRQDGYPAPEDQNISTVDVVCAPTSPASPCACRREGYQSEGKGEPRDRRVWRMYICLDSGPVPLSDRPGLWRVTDSEGGGDCRNLCDPLLLFSQCLSSSPPFLGASSDPHTGKAESTCHFQLVRSEGFTVSLC